MGVFLIVLKQPCIFRLKYLSLKWGFQSSEMLRSDAVDQAWWTWDVSSCSPASGTMTAGPLLTAIIVTQDPSSSDSLPLRGCGQLCQKLKWHLDPQTCHWSPCFPSCRKTREEMCRYEMRFVKPAGLWQESVVGLRRSGGLICS